VQKKLPLSLLYRASFFVTIGVWLAGLVFVLGFTLLSGSILAFPFLLALLILMAALGVVGPYFSLPFLFLWPVTISLTLLVGIKQNIELKNIDYTPLPLIWLYSYYTSGLLFLYTFSYCDEICQTGEPFSGGAVIGSTLLGTILTTIPLTILMILVINFIKRKISYRKQTTPQS
jgi:hypothetical protein